MEEIENKRKIGWKKMSNKLANKIIINNKMDVVYKKKKKKKMKVSNVIIQQ